MQNLSNSVTQENFFQLSNAFYVNAEILDIPLRSFFKLLLVLFIKQVLDRKEIYFCIICSHMVICLENSRKMTVEVWDRSPQKYGTIVY